MSPKKVLKTAVIAELSIFALDTPPMLYTYYRSQDLQHQESSLYGAFRQTNQLKEALESAYHTPDLSDSSRESIATLQSSLNFFSSKLGQEMLPLEQRIDLYRDLTITTAQIEFSFALLGWFTFILYGVSREEEEEHQKPNA